MTTASALFFLMNIQKQHSRGVLSKRCSENTGEHPCRSVISWVFSCNLLYSFRTPFSRITTGWLLLYVTFHLNLLEPFSCFFHCAVNMNDPEYVPIDYFAFDILSSNQVSLKTVH